MWISSDKNENLPKFILIDIPVSDIVNNFSNNTTQQKAITII